MLTLDLVALPASRVTGIYAVKGVPSQLPDRMRYLHPTAAVMWKAIEGWAVVSDMFRSPESSLQAVREGRGALPPGFSAHNYGLAIDLDLAASMRRLAALIGRSAVTKAELDDAMRAAGWWCFFNRPNTTREKESWHYNALSIHATVKGQLTTDEVETRILDLYGKYLDLDDISCQAALRYIKLYHGGLDGDIGPLTEEATRAFQRAWGLRETGDLDRRTRRTLAYVACARTVSVAP